MTKEEIAVKPHEAAAPVKVVPAQALSERLDQAKEKIGRRAYEIFERRGRAHGRDMGDWLQAESELLHRFPHTVAETANTFVVFAELRGVWNAADLVVGVEARRLILSGEREVHVTYSHGGGSRTEKRVHSILHVLDLPVNVDPSRATASLVNKTLEIVMPKV